MSLSQSRKAQIESNLAKHGVTTDETAINGVVAILKDDQRATVASACRRYAQSVNPQVKVEEQPKADRQTSPDINEQNSSQQMLVEMTVRVSNNQVNFINNAALNLTMQRLLMGDMGELTPETKAKLDEFDKQMKEVKTIDVNFLELASTTSQTNLLPSSEGKEEKLLQSNLEPIS